MSNSYRNSQNHLENIKAYRAWYEDSGRAKHFSPALKNAPNRNSEKSRYAPQLNGLHKELSVTDIRQQAAAPTPMPAWTVTSKKVELAKRPFSGKTLPNKMANRTASKITKEDKENDSKSLLQFSNMQQDTKLRPHEVTEVVVFMPIVDCENDRIWYPKSKIPTVKRYTLGRYAKKLAHKRKQMMTRDFGKVYVCVEAGSRTTAGVGQDRREASASLTKAADSAGTGDVKKRARKEDGASDVGEDGDAISVSLTKEAGSAGTGDVKKRARKEDGASDVGQDRCAISASLTKAAGSAGSGDVKKRARKEDGASDVGQDGGAISVSLTKAAGSAGTGDPETVIQARNENAERSTGRGVPASAVRDNFVRNVTNGPLDVSSNATISKRLTAGENQTNSGFDFSGVSSGLSQLDNVAERKASSRTSTTTDDKSTKHATEPKDQKPSWRRFIKQLKEETNRENIKLAHQQGSPRASDVTGERSGLIQPQFDSRTNPPQSIDSSGCIGKSVKNKPKVSKPETIAILTKPVVNTKLRELSPAVSDCFLVQENCESLENTTGMTKESYPRTNASIMNGWRRTTLTPEQLPSIKSSSANNWRPRKQDDISMECWLDRCKYLRSREQSWRIPENTKLAPQR